MLSVNASLRPELQGVVKGDHLPDADRKMAWHTMSTDKADGRSNESCYTKRITAHTLNTERSGQPLMHIILCAAKFGAASPKSFWQLLTVLLRGEDLYPTLMPWQRPFRNHGPSLGQPNDNLQ